MAYKYSVNERIYGGSMDPRLSHETVDQRLNARLHAELPRSMHATEDGSVGIGQNQKRRREIGMPAKFIRGED